MQNIIVIPLDERPCNLRFPALLGAMTDINVILPPKDILGNKKEPAAIDRVWAFLKEHITSATGVVLSIDMLLYGGIVPSRLHDDDVETLKRRLARLEELKQDHPSVTFYAYHLIMRNPTYSSSDEEPDYYERVGREIHLRGVYEHKQAIGILSTEEEKDYARVLTTLDDASWNDYTARRQRNLALDIQSVDYVASGVIDFLIVPQDDASPYGLTAIDQQQLRKHIAEQNVTSKVLMYPGADEVANTLIARMVNHLHQRQLKVALKYTSEQGKFVIPLYEDRPLGETVKYQIMAAGGIVVQSDTDADLILIVNAPSGKMLNASEAFKKGLEYDAFRNLVEAVDHAAYWIDKKKPVAIADVAYGNGSDLDLIRLLGERELLFRVAGYAGWNTSSNTLGTVIPHGMFFASFGSSQAHLDFLSLRYVEDAGYCAVVRQATCQHVLPTLGLDYFHADGERGQVSAAVAEQLEQFISSHLVDANHDIVIRDCWMPWRRMFEVGLDTKVVKK